MHAFRINLEICNFALHGLYILTLKLFMVKGSDDSTRIVGSFSQHIAEDVLHQKFLLYLCPCWIIHTIASFFFCLGFFSRTLTIHRKAGEGEAFCLTPLYHFHLLQRHLDISWAITADSSPLHRASSRTQTGNPWFPNASR